MSFYEFLMTKAHYTHAAAETAIRNLRRIYNTTELHAFYRPYDPDFEGTGTNSFEGPDPWEYIRMWHEYNRRGGDYDREALKEPPAATSVPFLEVVNQN